MIGHQCIINLRKGGKKPRSAFFFLGIYPYPTHDVFNPENALLRHELPEVWVGNANPYKTDLSFVKNLVIHLIDFEGKSDIETYMNWWIALVNAEPKLLIGVDWDKQLNIWRKDVNH